jgi:ATP/maltotriose-dependent transcriptional regulator MalT
VLVGDYAGAREVLERANTAAVRLGLAPMAVVTRAHLAHACVALGDLPAAREHGSEALRAATELGVPRLRAVALTAFGEVQLACGQCDDAERDLLEAVGLPGIAPSYRADAILALAELHLQRARPKDALVLVDEVESSAQSAGTFGSMAHRTGLVRVEALQMLGRLDEAEALTHALCHSVREQAATLSDEMQRSSYVESERIHAKLIDWERRFAERRVPG